MSKNTPARQSARRETGTITNRAATAPASSKRHHPITYLPFVRDLAEDGADDMKRCFWHVIATGDVSLDNELGGHSPAGPSPICARMISLRFSGGLSGT